VKQGHGPLGALYPTNTTHKQKEGDSGTFVYLIPNGLNEPGEPRWGGWAGRYGPMDGMEGRPYYWANQEDAWNGTKHRENTLARWAEHLQNDFAARMDWCVAARSAANHPPQVKLAGEWRRKVKPGERVGLDASASTDPDGHKLTYEWIVYPEASGFTGEVPAIEGAHAAQASLAAPASDKPASLHVILIATDSGTPPLTRYARVVLEIQP
jgi:hypothetical protein